MCKRKTRAIAALLLTLALVLSVRIPALAAEPQAHDHAHADAAVCTDASGGVDPQASCSVHVWKASQSILLPGEGVYINANRCESHWKETRTCKKCNATEIVGYYSVPNDTHRATPYTSSCDGRTQTIHNRCAQCFHTMATTTQVCPGGPHTGMCRWLPA